MKDIAQNLFVDSVFILHVETLGARGAGLAKIENFVIFIPDAKVGKTYKVKITNVLSRFAFAKFIEELKA